MESRARIAGYATVLALLIFAGWIGIVVMREALHPHRIIQVRFQQQLGTLKIEDPVVQNGVPIGQIKSLRLQDGAPVAEIELFNREFIPSDSRFVDFNHSLMGARLIVLRPGRSSLPMDEHKIQDGFFAEGIAERIHRISALMGKVAELRKQTDRLFVGPGAPFSPALLGDLERDVAELNRLAGQVDHAGNALRSGLQGWNRTANSLHTALKSTSKVDTMERSMERMLSTVLSSEQSADALLTSAERLLAMIQDSTGKVDVLLTSHKAYDDLEGSVRFLKNALNVLQTQGLADVVKWKNVHFFKSKSP